MHAAVFLPDEKPGIFENAQMLGNGGQRDVERFGEPGHR